jgi:hypothetical protein
MNISEEAISEMLYGTRAEGTERLVYRILQTPEYRTVEIVTRFPDAAIIGGSKSPENLRFRSLNIINRIAKYGERAIPRNEVDLVSWSDLAMSEPGQPSAKGVRRTPRKFKLCKQCKVRFLAKRVNQEFHTKKCSLRWNRANASTPMMLETARTLSEAA